MLLGIVLLVVSLRTAWHLAYLSAWRELYPNGAIWRSE